MKQHAHLRKDSLPWTIDEQDDAEIHRALQSIRIWLGIFIVGLILSGITAFPLAFELRHLVGFLGSGLMLALSQSTHLLPWIERVNEGVQNTDARYPFLAYGTDWLAFAHLVVALAFIGPWIEPLRNKWVIHFGLIACLGVVPLALIAGPIRGIPFPWRLIDCSFGIFGSIPLLVSRRLVSHIERHISTHRLVPAA